jgi:hypothetical protein
MDEVTCEVENIPPFQCKRCGYNTVYKCNLLKHLKRKMKCEATVDDIAREELIDEISSTIKDVNINEKNYPCKYCDRKFNSSSNRSKHHKVCKEKDKTIQFTKKDLQDLESKIAERIKKELKEHNSVVNVNNYYTYITNNNINVKPYNKLKGSWVKENFDINTERLLTEGINDGTHCISTYHKHKYGNPEFPDQICMVMNQTDYKNGIIRVFNERWEAQDFKQRGKELINEALMHLLEIVRPEVCLQLFSRSKFEELREFVHKNEQIDEAFLKTEKGKDILRLLALTIMNITDTEIESL